ncbi:hypothetical protein JTB14_020099 [Gonioctena quinquepunctata]|nr:hypothetical protein JTB14_020099 [Gonioctena quinquepunctata]
MDVDQLDSVSESTATSIDENTENFCENPTRDTLAEGLMGLIKPTVDQLDERVRSTRISQLELKQCIESLNEELKNISESQKTTIDFDIYVKKLINAKQRVTVVSNILQNAQERLNKIHMSIDKEIVKRKVVLDNVEEPKPKVYEPSEDTFLLIDALEADIPYLLDLKPNSAVEIGSGSGVVITALSQIFHTSCMYFATDINPQCTLATKYTSGLNSANVEVVGMDLLSNFRTNIFDVIIFNPPYVVTESEELCGNGLNCAWAGGNQGRLIIDRLLSSLPNLLSESGVCYMVLLKENEPEEIVEILGKNTLKSKMVLQRKIPGEHLYVYKFFR